MAAFRREWSGPSWSVVLLSLSVLCTVLMYVCKSDREKSPAVGLTLLDEHAQELGDFKRHDILLSLCTARRSLRYPYVLPDVTYTYKN